MLKQTWGHGRIFCSFFLHLFLIVSIIVGYCRNGILTPLFGGLALQVHITSFTTHAQTHAHKHCPNHNKIHASFKLCKLYSQHFIWQHMQPSKQTMRFATTALLTHHTTDTGVPSVTAVHFCQLRHLRTVLGSILKILDFDL